MSERAILSIGIDRSASVLDIMTLGFARDPMARFWWSEASEYLHWWPRWVMAIGRGGFINSGVDALDDFSSAAIWLPPGVESDPADISALDLPEGDAEEEALAGALRLAMEKHHPDHPHWYLWTLATDPAREGEGGATRLMEHRLAIVDRDAMPAYLEASNPALVPFYRKFGFEQVGTIEVSPAPPLVPMYRAAR